MTSHTDQQAPYTAANSQHQTPVFFIGDTREYFGIWIVNILLTIVTLGIYSAWATVRTKKYFANNTQIGGVGFDYHAEPLRLLKGRAIAVGVYLAYAVLSKNSPVIASILLLLLACAMPWLIVQSMRFNLYNTSYRGLRFGFTGKVREAAGIYLGLPILFVLTAGLILPYFSYRSTRYRVENIKFGTSHFTPNFSVKAVYIIYLELLGLLIATTGMLFFLGWIAISAIGNASSTQVLGILPLIVMLFSMYIARPFLSARLGNLTYNATKLDQIAFKSDMRARDLFWIQCSNFIGILVTLGLLIPWAKIRTARYLADHLSLHSDASLDDFIADKQEQLSATGEEIAEIFDIDVPILG